ncbi:MAG: hypothetical protein UY76_C0053G0007 [Candidatus Uhrbacteria bacterium GW2011_GWA2_52_8d]|uniref:Uncharacterized protein n=1 Tax=Candidatus Uhrbacteria bacterium GW2011_GWA2_52_8d TaxID=1618979 RepID=A0A0G1XLD6_9BACT|nr:MAG: hypothetical protein UY76_C0053G0007 [Candidatus Uhrbacteria bacterium GW2011_GWA2_52_8d]
MSTSDKSEWSVVGLAHKFGLAWERVGGTLAEINRLAEDSLLLASFVGVLHGTHEISPRQFPTWKVIKLGLHKSPEAYALALEAKGRKISKWARDILAQITCSQEVVELELVDVSGAELGFREAYTTRECYERAATFGLYPCPAETGSATSDQYDDQPPGEWRRIAMEAIADSGGVLHVFNVGHGGVDLWLGTSDGRPEDRWDPDRRWVFCRRKP